MNHSSWCRSIRKIQLQQHTSLYFAASTNLWTCRNCVDFSSPSWYHIIPDVNTGNKFSYESYSSVPKKFFLKFLQISFLFSERGKNQLICCNSFQISHQQWSIETDIKLSWIKMTEDEHWHGGSYKLGYEVLATSFIIRILKHVIVRKWACTAEWSHLRNDEGKYLLS